MSFLSAISEQMLTADDPCPLILAKLNDLEPILLMIFFFILIQIQYKFHLLLINF